MLKGLKTYLARRTIRSPRLDSRHLEVVDAQNTSSRGLAGFGIKKVRCLIIEQRFRRCIENNGVDVKEGFRNGKLGVLDS